MQADTPLLISSTNFEQQIPAVFPRISSLYVILPREADSIFLAN